MGVVVDGVDGVCKLEYFPLLRATEEPTMLMVPANTVHQCTRILIFSGIRGGDNSNSAEEVATIHRIEKGLAAVKPHSLSPPSFRNSFGNVQNRPTSHIGFNHV